MRIFNKNIISGLLLTTLSLVKDVKAGDTVIDKSKIIKDDYLKNTSRAKLFKKTDFNVPDIHIKMSEEQFKELVDSASAGFGNFGFGGFGGFGNNTDGGFGNFTMGPPPPPPFGNNTEGGGWPFPPKDGNFTMGGFGGFGGFGNKTEGEGGGWPFPPKDGNFTMGGFGGFGGFGNKTEGEGGGWPFPPPPKDGNFTMGDFGGFGGFGNKTEGEGGGWPFPPMDGNFTDGGDFPFPKPGKEEEEYKVSDASLEFILNGESTTVDSVTVSVGGQFSKNSKKLGYNIKCNSGSLFGRKIFRLRSNVDDLTMMRAKLSCDVLNRLGLPSVSANYARLYINDQFLGFYILLDAYKTSWIKKVYEDDEEVENLYQCKEMNSDFSKNNVRLCVNANEKYANNTENLEEFITTINAAKSRKDVEGVMNVDLFIKVWIVEWLLGSWDHSLINGKNYFLYKQVNGKWNIFIYDFDGMFGQNTMMMLGSNNPAAIPFDKWHRKRYIVDVLVDQDQASFVKNLQEVVDKAFNPDLLFSHIDAVKSWISPYVLEDRTPVNGTLPGFINSKGMGFGNGHTFEEFEKNTEFTDFGFGIALKKWIQDRYEFACSNYELRCSSSVDSKPSDNKDNKETETTTDNKESDAGKEAEETKDTQDTKDKNSKDNEETKDNKDNKESKEEGEKEKDNKDKKEVNTCWAEEEGYECCSHCNGIYVDELGLWGVDNGIWCGIDYESCTTKYNSECWSEGFGYPCCESTCDVYAKDNKGYWGYENGEWCGINYNYCIENGQNLIFRIPIKN